MTTIIIRAAESVHWYQQDGAPKYTVKAKDGSDRPTTLRDARKLKLVPSVTTILKVAAKPGLEVWKQEQLMLACLTLQRLSNESEKDFIARIVADSKATAKQAAERGTSIHESVEKWFAGNVNVEHPEMAKATKDELDKYFGYPQNTWVSEASFSTNGFGGKVDLHMQPSSEVPEGIVADVKTKEFGPDDDVVAYDEHLMQLAAYREGLGLDKARCANIFVSSTRPGLVKIIEWSQEDLARGLKMFHYLLSYWYLKNNFGV